MQTFVHIFGYYLNFLFDTIVLRKLIPNPTNINNLQPINDNTTLKKTNHSQQQDFLFRYKNEKRLHPSKCIRIGLKIPD
jgi:hypothetical protein